MCNFMFQPHEYLPGCQLINISLYLSLPLSLSIYIYIYIYTCISVYIYIYIHKKKCIYTVVLFASVIQLPLRKLNRNHANIYAHLRSHAQTLLVVRPQLHACAEYMSSSRIMHLIKCVHARAYARFLADASKCAMHACIDASM